MVTKYWCSIKGNAREMNFKTERVPRKYPLNKKKLSEPKPIMPETDQPLSPAGRLFLQPLMNQVIICAVASELPIAVDSLKTQIQNSKMLTHPRFCSLMVRDPCGREHWRRTPVDVDRHLIIHRRSLSDDPSVTDEDAVNEYVSALSYSAPLSTDKPLWEIHVLAAHKAAVFRVHHALGDGVSLMELLLSNCRRAENPAEMPDFGVSAAARLEQPARSWWSAWAVVKVVWFSLVYVLGVLLRVLWVRDKTTVLSGGDGVELWPRRLATARFRLDDMKTVKKAVAGSTINDVLFGVISSGLSSYLDTRSPKSLREGCQITGLAMVNLRPHQGLQELTNEFVKRTGRGNKFGVILLPVYYYYHSNPLEYVMRAKSMIDKKKLSLEALFTYKLMDFITSLFGPKLTSILNHRLICNSTFTISNIVGPGEKISLVGNPVKYIRVTSSSLPHAITMHMLSYAGNADMQILVAKDIIPDPKVLAKCFEDALFQMKQAAENVLHN